MNRFFSLRNQEEQRRKRGTPPVLLEKKSHSHSRHREQDEDGHCCLDMSSSHTKDVSVSSSAWEDSETVVSIRETSCSSRSSRRPTQKLPTTARTVRNHLRRQNSGAASLPADGTLPLQQKKVSSSSVGATTSAYSSLPPRHSQTETAAEPSSSTAAQQYHDRVRSGAADSTFSDRSQRHPKKPSTIALGTSLDSVAAVSQQSSNRDEKQRTTARELAEQAKLSYYTKPPTTSQADDDALAAAQTSRWIAEERKLARYNSQGLPSTTRPHEDLQHPVENGDEEEPSCWIPPPMIEIFPGFSVPLRGSQETRLAVQRDFITPAMCFTCDSEMFCIQDAEYVLCPHCRAINPLTTTEADICGGWTGGLGLGISLAVLYSLQQEIVDEYRILHRHA